MRIPTSFKLINRTYKIRPMREDVSNASKAIGHCHYDNADIEVKLDGKQELIEHTFYHELTHALLHASTKPKLAKDEKFVDHLAALIHQYEQTKKGELKTAPQ